MAFDDDLFDPSTYLQGDNALNDWASNMKPSDLEAWANQHGLSDPGLHAQMVSNPQAAMDNLAARGVPPPPDQFPQSTGVRGDRLPQQSPLTPDALQQYGQQQVQSRGLGVMSPFPGGTSSPEPLAPEQGRDKVYVPGKGYMDRPGQPQPAPTPSPGPIRTKPSGKIEGNLSDYDDSSVHAGEGGAGYPGSIKQAPATPAPAPTPPPDRVYVTPKEKPTVSPITPAEVPDTEHPLDPKKAKLEELKKAAKEDKSSPLNDFARSMEGVKAVKPPPVQPVGTPSVRSPNAIQGANLNALLSMAGQQATGIPSQLATLAQLLARGRA